MHRFPRSLATLAGLTLFASALPGAPQISIGPGVISTAASGTNNTLAGNPDGGTAGIPPNFNGVACSSPTSCAAIYVSDFSKHQVFRVDLTSGQVTPFAGNGTTGNSGDGGPATSAQLNEPSGIAVDASGNVYVADTTANVIRRIDASGVITTVAGDGTAGTPAYNGDGPATSRQIAKPIGVAVDAGGTLYIAASTQGRILRLSAGTITSIAGNGSGGPFTDGVATGVALQLPAGVSVDPITQDVYFSETLGNVVRRITGGNVVTIAGQVNQAGSTGDGGPGASARLNVPYGLAFDNGGGLYIADTSNHRIRKVTTDAGRTITTIAGGNGNGYSGDGGAALSAQLNGPGLVALDRSTGTLYINDSGNRAIRLVTGSGSSQTYASVGQSATFTVSNIGDAALSGAPINLPSANFAVTGGTCGSNVSLPPGQSCTVVVQASGSGSTTMTVGSGSVSSSAYLAIAGGYRFIPVTPCRAVDTRRTETGFGAPYVTGGAQRNFEIRNSARCAAASIPSSVQAYSLNVTVVPRGSTLQYLTVFPGGSTAIPFVSTINSFDARTKANAAIVPAGDGRVGVFASNDTEVVIDVNGYYVPASDASAQAFYPLPPCRLSDTRRPAGDFGAPLLTGSGSLNEGQAAPTARTIPVRNGACNVPANATAYSLNITGVPRAGRLTYLTIWPTNSSSIPPFVSTLNSPTGTVMANAAIVPAGDNGSISAYATENTDLIVDINGYYAPAGASGLSLYNVTPCRAFDSRGIPNAATPLPAGTVSRPLNNFGSCYTVADGTGITPALPSNAQSWVLNTTVVPTGQLIYLANWARGSAQPLQSTLNAYDGSVSSNLAVVPTIDGSISSYLTAPSGLVIDVFGYFAP